MASLAAFRGMRMVAASPVRASRVLLGAHPVYVPAAGSRTLVRCKSSSSAAVDAAATLPGGRSAALAAALRHIEGAFGKGSIMQLGARATAAMHQEVIPTGSLALDHALGIGGLPRGRVVEIYGAESSGKTTLALHAIAEAQRMGLNACFIDAEHAIDPIYARAVGVNLDALYLSQPDTGEQALEIADTLVRSGAVDILVVDSVAALVPRAEIEGEMGDHHMALQARLMSQALRKLTASLGKSKTLIIFINQIRHKVGVMFGNPEVTSGGNALKFYASVRLEIRRTGQLKRGEEVVGNSTRVKVSKNKLAPPFRTADFDMTYGTGIARSSEVAELGVMFGILRKSGAWFAITNETLLAAVNAAGTEAHPVNTAPAPAAPVALPPAAPAAGKKKGKKGAAAPAPAVDDTIAAATPVPVTPAPAPVPAPTAAPAAPRAVLNEPFVNGKDKLKAFLEMYPSVLQVAVTLIRAAMKEQPVLPAAPGGGAAAVAPAAPAAEEDTGVEEEYQPDVAPPAADARV